MFKALPELLSYGRIDDAVYIFLCLDAVNTIVDYEFSTEAVGLLYGSPIDFERLFLKLFQSGADITVISGEAFENSRADIVIGNSFWILKYVFQILFPS